MNSDFITQKPHNQHLSSLVDYYFFIDTPTESLVDQEYMLPFPRITFGYFFNHPFLVTNHDLKQSEKVDMAISRISSDKITVLPLTDRIKIIGAHVRPYTLAHLTQHPINSLPWLINTELLFGKTAFRFRKRIQACKNPTEMFEQVETVFLDTLLNRDLDIIKQAVDLVEEKKGEIKLSQLSDCLGISDRGLRLQFQKHIGCAPKEFFQLVQLRNSVYQMHATNSSLTNITYENNYFDQAHFINAFKKITGKSPKALRKEMANFRFLQF